MIRLIALFGLVLSMGAACGAEVAGLDQMVLDELAAVKIPDGLRPVFLEFSHTVASKMTKVTRWEPSGKKLFSSSIAAKAVKVCHRESNPARIKAALDQFLKILAHHGYLAGITDDSLNFDWAGVRTAFDRDMALNMESIREFYRNSTVLVIDPMAVREQMKEMEKIEDDAMLKAAVMQRLNEISAEYKTARYVGDFFLIGAFKYKGKTTAEKVRLLQANIEKALTVDGIAIFSEGLLSHVCDRAQGALLADSTSLDIDDDFRFVKCEFDFARSHDLLEGHAALAYGSKPIGADLLSGKRFEFEAQDESDMSALIARTLLQTEMEQLLDGWLSGIARRLKSDDLASDILWKMFKSWRTKVLSLNEFGGSKHDNDIVWPPQEAQLFKLFKNEVKTIALFTNKKVSFDERLQPFLDEFLGDGFKNYEARYTPVLNSLQKWLDERRKAIPPAVVRDAAISKRTRYLFDFLIDDIHTERKLSPSGSRFILLNQTASGTHAKLEQMNAFALGRAIKHDLFLKLTPAERALYDYFKAALKDNPLYKDFTVEKNMQTLFTEYWAYRKSEPKPSDQAAFEKARKALADLISGMDKDDDKGRKKAAP